MIGNLRYERNSEQSEVKRERVRKERKSVKERERVKGEERESEKRESRRTR